MFSLPDFTTHHLFGEEVYTKLTPELQTLISKYPNVYHFGCQGPDLLFYHNVLKGKSFISHVGGMIHFDKNQEFLSAMSNYIAKKKGTFEYDLLSAYYFGFLCHFQCDAYCHPYIYYHEQRIWKKNQHISPNAIHAYIEADIDTAYMQYSKGLSIHEFSVSKQYHLSNKEKLSIANMYSFLVREVYDFYVNPKDIMTCFKSIVQYSQWFYSRNPIFYHLAILGEKISKKPKAFTAHFKGRKNIKGCLNLSHAPWNNLWYPSDFHEESFLEILDQAEQKTIATIEHVFSKLQHNDGDLSLHIVGCFAHGIARPDLIQG